MRLQNLVLGIIAGAVLSVFVVHQSGLAEAQKPAAPVKAAVVSVGKVFETSKKHKQWQEQMQAEQDKINTEMKTLENEIKAIAEDIKTRQPGGSDYFRLLQSHSEKDAILKSKSRTYEQQVLMKMQYWTETMYKELLGAASDIAKGRGYDIVVSKEVMEFPAEDMNSLMTMIRTNTVIYHSSEIDITDEVIAAIDSRP